MAGRRVGFDAAQDHEKIRTGESEGLCGRGVGFDAARRLQHAGPCRRTRPVPPAAPHPNSHMRTLPSARVAVVGWGVSRAGQGGGAGRVGDEGLGVGEWGEGDAALDEACTRSMSPSTAPSRVCLQRLSESVYGAFPSLSTAPPVHCT